MFLKLSGRTINLDQVVNYKVEMNELELTMSNHQTVCIRGTADELALWHATLDDTLGALSMADLIKNNQRNFVNDIPPEILEQIKKVNTPGAAFEVKEIPTVKEVPPCASSSPKKKPVRRS